MLPMIYKNGEPITSIVDRGSGIHIISKRLYDAWDLPKMEPAMFSIKSANQRKVAPLGLVVNLYVGVVGI